MQGCSGNGCWLMARRAGVWIYGPSVPWVSALNLLHPLTPHWIPEAGRRPRSRAKRGALAEQRSRTCGARVPSGGDIWSDRRDRSPEDPQKQPVRRGSLWPPGLNYNDGNTLSTPPIFPAIPYSACPMFLSGWSFCPYNDKGNI